MKEKQYNKKQFLHLYDQAIKRGKGVLAARFGSETAGEVIRESRAEYEALIPRIPFIGVQNPMLIFLVPSVWSLALYRVLRSRGLGLDEAGRIIYGMNEADMKGVPFVIRRFIGYLWFSKWFAKRLKQRAEESQKREYPGNYVFTYVEGDGRSFDFGVDYAECASCKFLQKENAPELMPFICACDKAAGDLMYWGLTRTKTIAAGAETCDFRFKKGGKTNIGPIPV